MKQIFVLSQVTFQEIQNDKIFYNVLAAAALLTGLNIFTSKLTVYSSERYLLDIGLSIVNLSTGLIATIFGSSLLNREFDRKTAHLILCRPITAQGFLLSKYIGLAMVLIINWALLTLLVVLGTYLLAGDTAHITASLLYHSLFVIAQGLILASFGVLFATFSSTTLSVLFTTGLFVLGKTRPQLDLVISKMDSPLQDILSVFTQLIPNLSYFDLSLKVTYGLPTDPKHAFMILGYGGVTVLLSLASASILISNKT